jgi:hypothetical protein
VTVKNAELRLVTTADQFAGIADGSSSGWAPVTVALIRVLASVTVTGEGEATAAGERGTAGWLVAALGETAEVGVPDVARPIRTPEPTPSALPLDEPERVSQLQQLALDPAIPPPWVLAGQPEDQVDDLWVHRRPQLAWALAEGGPLAAYELAMPPQDRLWTGQ